MLQQFYLLSVTLLLLKQLNILSDFFVGPFSGSTAD